jgi:hypothetical protein
MQNRLGIIILVAVVIISFICISLFYHTSTRDDWEVISFKASAINTAITALISLLNIIVVYFIFRDNSEFQITIQQSLSSIDAAGKSALVTEEYKLLSIIIKLNSDDLISLVKITEPNCSTFENAIKIIANELPDDRHIYKSCIHRILSSIERFEIIAISNDRNYLLNSSLITSYKSDLSNLL